MKQFQALFRVRINGWLQTTLYRGEAKSKAAFMRAMKRRAVQQQERLVEIREA